MGDPWVIRTIQFNDVCVTRPLPHFNSRTLRPTAAPHERLGFATSATGAQTVVVSTVSPHPPRSASSLPIQTAPPCVRFVTHLFASPALSLISTLAYPVQLQPGICHVSNRCAHPGRGREYSFTISSQICLLVSYSDRRGLRAPSNFAAPHATRSATSATGGVGPYPPIRLSPYPRILAVCDALIPVQTRLNSRVSLSRASPRKLLLPDPATPPQTTSQIPRCPPPPPTMTPSKSSQ